MADRDAREDISDLSAGRNGVDPPQSLTPKECVEAINVDWNNATLARKRNGVAAVSTTSSPFTGYTVSSLYRHVPTTDETLAELWATDDAATHHIGRLAGGTAWSTPTLKDDPTGYGWNVSYASLNGKLFIAYKSAVDRLHCWDPYLSKVRRTGLAVMGVPTVANSGTGSYTATIQYYRTRATEQRSGVTVRRSEPSTAASITPSGVGSGVLITQGTPPGEDETHWEVEGSEDGTTFYLLSTIAIGTTTYTNTAAVTTFADGTVSATAGTYGLQRSYRSIASDQGRLLGFGAWSTTGPQNRVEFSAVLGSSDIGDDERVPLNNWVGLDENSSGPAIGLKGPMNGAFYAFKLNQTWRLQPTGSSLLPYQAKAMSRIIGAVSEKSLVLGEDEIGNPCIYWMSAQGPYRYGANGIEYLGRAVEDYTVSMPGEGKRLSLDAAHLICHGLWHPQKRQVWFWVATQDA